jgi:hypothetical protein
MSSFNPFATILYQNKLTGPNYVDWKRNLDIVLTIEGHKYVLSQPCPEFPTLEASQEDKKRYDLWQKSNEMAKCYILASVSNVIQHQMQNLSLALDIMVSLEEMFDEQIRAAWSSTVRALFNAKMAEGTPVRGHCLKMISMLNILEVLDAGIDVESQVDMILQSLPESFNEFRLNVSMGKRDYTLFELMNELIIVEGILKAKASRNMSQTSSKPKGWKKKFTKQVGKAVGMKKVGKKSKAKLHKKCFYCDKAGHRKRNCTKYLASKRSGLNLPP